MLNARTRLAIKLIAWAMIALGVLGAAGTLFDHFTQRAMYDNLIGLIAVVFISMSTPVVLGTILLVLLSIDARLETRS